VVSSRILKASTKYRPSFLNLCLLESQELSALIIPISIFSSPAKKHVLRKYNIIIFNITLNLSPILKYFIIVYYLDVLAGITACRSCSAWLICRKALLLRLRISCSAPTRLVRIGRPVPPLGYTPCLEPLSLM